MRMEGRRCTTRLAERCTCRLRVVMQRLLEGVGEQRADIRAKDKHSDTALHCAALEGHVAAVVRLLLGGVEGRAANVSAKDADGCRPLHYASERGHLEVAQLLEDASRIRRMARWGCLGPVVDAMTRRGCCRTARMPSEQRSTLETVLEVHGTGI